MGYHIGYIDTVITWYRYGARYWDREPWWWLVVQVFGTIIQIITLPFLVIVGGKMKLYIELSHRMISWIMQLSGLCCSSILDFSLSSISQWGYLFVTITIKIFMWGLPHRCKYIVSLMHSSINLCYLNLRFVWFKILRCDHMLCLKLSFNFLGFYLHVWDVDLVVYYLVMDTQIDQ